MQGSLGQPYYHMDKVDKWVVDHDDNDGDDDGNNHDDDDDVKVMKRNIMLRKKVTMAFWQEIMKKWW